MNQKVGFASGKIKILHHQGCDINKLLEFEKVLNQTEEKRVTTFEDTPCRVITDSYKSRKYMIKNSNIEQIKSLFKDAKRKQEKDGTVEMLQIGARLLYDLLLGR